jgi:beta-glucosidase
VLYSYTANRSKKNRFGTYSVSRAVNAGLDIEMPGPSRFRGSGLVHAITSNKVSERTINERVRNVLEMVKSTSKSGIPENAVEIELNRPEDQLLLRRAASESVVLLKNDDAILPLDRTKKTLVLGPNANIAAYAAVAPLLFLLIMPSLDYKALGTSPPAR